MAEKREKPLVLVADDEIATTVMLARIFEREGYSVQSVHDGSAAVTTANELIPDLILLDVQMPLMNGFDALRNLRQNSTTANIPTIIVTAKATQPTDVAQGLNLGADDFIQKPFAPQELLARAQSKIRARKLEDALQRRTSELESLLNVSQELNQYHEINDVMELIPRLTLTLLPGDVALIYQINETGAISAKHIHSASTQHSPTLQHEKLAKEFLRTAKSVIWSPDTPALPKGFDSGMLVPLIHDNRILGILAVFSNDGDYDQTHLRLFEGLSGQAALTLRNAQLYEIQANYAHHLQDMVDAKTKELQSAQQMLIRSEKLASIGHLAASIAHEINNPLQPMRLILDGMASDIESNIPVEERDVKVILESVERIHRIVKELLDFAGNRSSTNTEVHLLDVSKVIGGVVTLNRKFFEKEGLNIVSDLSPSLMIYGSKDQLEQVFMNLALNAKAAMNRNGVLRIEAQLAGEEIVIKFADTGHGIPPELINKIFDPFFSTKSNSTGLGLFVSYGIIEGHHGKIEVQSEQDKGTVFTITLPVHKESEQKSLS